jgi:hypothetical protein
VRKCAFILAILSGRCLSELFGLKCDVNHLQISNEFVQLVPASLSKTDRAGRLGPPICLISWRDDVSICPVAAIRVLLEARDVLDIRHDRLFFNAPPGSTCATTASSALGRGVCMGDILQMRDWSACSTFLRHYAALLQVSEVLVI